MKTKALFWIPCIITILAILFMMMFSLVCFEMSGLDVPLCFFMHNIPALILVLVLIISWKWELIGGILTILASIFGFAYFNRSGENWGVVFIMAPFLLAGILFIAHHFVAKRSGIRE